MNLNSFDASTYIILALWCPLFVRAGNYAGGTGEPNNPYQIATGEQLISIGSDPNLLDRHFVLLDDIDLDPSLPGGRIFSNWDFENTWMVCEGKSYPRLWWEKTDCDQP